jgi:hypothetical protein
MEKAPLTETEQKLFIMESLKVAQEVMEEQQKEIETLKECVNNAANDVLASVDKMERFEKALTLALMILENNNLMNDDYKKIHSILDGEEE